MFKKHPSSRHLRWHSEEVYDETDDDTESQTVEPPKHNDTPTPAFLGSLSSANVHGSSVWPKVILQFKGQRKRSSIESTPTTQKNNAEVLIKQHNTMVIQVESAGYNGGNYASIAINDVPVELPKNRQNH